MNYNPFADLFMYVYEHAGAAPKQKIQKAHEFFHNMSYVWEEDLKTFCHYSENQLPIIEGVEVKTKGRGYVRDYIVITKYPSNVDPNVQKTIARLLGELGGFECDKWGIGQMNKTISRHLNEYMSAYSKDKEGMKLGSQCGYPKVYTFNLEIWDEAPNESYSVMELTGFVLD